MSSISVVSTKLLKDSLEITYSDNTKQTMSFTGTMTFDKGLVVNGGMTTLNAGLIAKQSVSLQGPTAVTDQLKFL